MKRDTLMMIGIGFIGLAFVLAVLSAVLLSERNETNQMKACVAAGKEWKRDFGNHYECVDD